MLSFQSLQEVEMAMARKLSYAEKIWFDYSSKKSDILLFSHSFLILFSVYSLVPLPLLIMEIRGVKFLQKYKIQKQPRLPLSTIFKCYKRAMTTYITLTLPLQLILYPVARATGTRTGLPLPSVWESLIHLLVYMLIEDYVNYWVHRLLHSESFYGNVHASHHTFETPFMYAGSYAHWIEVLLLGGPSVIGPILVPGHIITFWLWIALRQFEALDTHSGYNFPVNLLGFIPFYGGADHHDFHHYVGVQSKSNYATVFTYCDYIYGTDKGYKYYKEFVSKTKEKKRQVESYHNFLQDMVSKKM